MFENVSPGTYHPGDSLLHRLQPTTKLVALFWLVVFVAVANQRVGHFLPYAALVGLVCLAAVLGRAPASYLWQRTRLLGLSVVLGAVPTLLFAGGQPVRAIGPLVLTDDALWLLASVFLVLVVLYVCSLLLTLTTTPVALIDGLTTLLAPLRRLRLPVDDFALMTLISLRFVPTLTDEADQLVKAQTARGADFTHGSIRARLGSLATLFVPLVQGALRRADELATALEARGYGAAGRQTLLHAGRLQARDFAVLGVVLVVTLGSLLV